MSVDGASQSGRHVAGMEWAFSGRYEREVSNYHFLTSSCTDFWRILSGSESKVPHLDAFSPKNEKTTLSLNTEKTPNAGTRVIIY